MIRAEQFLEGSAASGKWEYLGSEVFFTLQAFSGKTEVM